MNFSIHIPRLFITITALSLLTIPSFLLAEERQIDSVSVEATISPDIYTGSDEDDSVEYDAEDVAINSDTSTEEQIETTYTRDTKIDSSRAPDRVQSQDNLRSNEIRRVSNFTDADDVLDPDDDVIEPAQDYNSTRSNRRKNVFDDGNDNSWPEATRQAESFRAVVNESNTSGIDERIFCWGRGEDSEGNVYAWGRGLCVALENVDESARDRIAALQVRGDDVRSWSVEEREAWREYRDNPENNRSEEILAEHMIERTQADERIKEIRVDSESAEVEYLADMRLFGFLKLQRNVTATVNTENKVNINYPWYSFLASKPQNKNIRSVLLDVMDMVVQTPTHTE